MAKDTAGKSITAPTAVWIAMATLHKKYKHDYDFKASEIIAKVKEQNLYELTDSAIRHHVTNNCVGNIKHNVWTLLCMTYRTGYGRYRLFKKGDKPHPTKKSGLIMPPIEKFPEKYKELYWWYLNSYRNHA